MKIMVDIDVCDKAEEMAEVLNTDIEGIFAFVSYRLMKKGNLCARVFRNLCGRSSSID
jgi:hypothetical protein